VSTQPPAPGQPQVPDPNASHCPRCSAPIGSEQDWCLECGAPARTRLAQTPNWRLPTVAIGAVVLVAGALLAFAFVKLTNDNDVPAGTTPTAVVTTPVAPPVVPAVTSALPTATSTAPAGPAVPTTVPGQATTPPPVVQTTTFTTPAPTTTGGQRTVPAFGQTTTTP
jgi:predicted nucleic acid-binding Zn ribbon protein